MMAYVHIPFCSSKCSYCAFNSFANLEHLQDSYIEALIDQIGSDFKNYSKVKSLYIGGGTPSSLSIFNFTKLLKSLDSRFSLDSVNEITVEINPNSSVEDHLVMLRDFGVDRVSFGIQSFNQKKLELLKREHNTKEAIKSITKAINLGFEKVSIDIIYGVVGDSVLFYKSEIDMASSLGATHLSAYELTIEAGDRFRKNLALKSDSDFSSDIISLAKEYGFLQYEVSNFGKNHKSLHNLGYWSGEEYLGFGAGAVGFLEDRRYYPHRAIKRYIKNPHFKNKEILTKSQLRSEKIFLGLRSEIGVEKSLLRDDDIEYLKGLNLIKIEPSSEQSSRIYSQNYMLCDEMTLKLL